MKHFTVIGYSENSGKTFFQWSTASTAEGAMQKVAEEHVKSGKDDSQLVVAIAGHHSLNDETDLYTLTFPGESVVDVQTYLELFE